MTPTLSRLPLRAGKPLSASDFAGVRRRAVLDHCKWDPQVGDQPTLAPFPVLMGARAWSGRCSLAEQLAAETEASEAELLTNTQARAALRLPSALERVF